METQNEGLFRLTERNIDQVRYIKLDKKAGGQQDKLKNVIVGQDAGTEIVQFYSFGFYDTLTCVKTQMRISRAHKKHFLINYPYRRTAEVLKVEQWFGLLPLSIGGKYQHGAENAEGMEPLFCREDLQEKLPFVGLVLISLRNTSNQFKPFLADCISEIEGALKEFDDRDDSRYLAQTYYSLNCVDLCLVIRTDSLALIHEANYKLNGRIGASGSQINTTVIFALQGMNGLKGDLEELKSKNKEVSFVVRSYQKYPDSDKKSYGVNGVGKYVTQFFYEEYLKYLPDLVYSKLNGTDVDAASAGSFVESICHEREWFLEEGYTVYKTDRNMGERENQRLAKAACQWIEDIYNKIFDVEEIAEEFFLLARDVYQYKEIFSEEQIIEEIFLFDKRIYQYKEIFVSEFRLVKDLVNTYADLWYQNVSESGFVFFAQLWTALQGIETMLHNIQEKKKLKDKTEVLEEFLDVLI